MPKNRGHWKKENCPLENHADGQPKKISLHMPIQVNLYPFLYKES